MKVFLLLVGLFLGGCFLYTYAIYPNILEEENLRNSTIELLNKLKYCKKSQLDSVCNRDSWGSIIRKFQYDDKIYIVSPGSDCKFGTDDDIVVKWKGE